jgi:hypothetical protein
MIMMKNAEAVETEVARRVGIETGAADLETDHTETETGVESGISMVDTEAIVERGARVIAIAIERTVTDVVRGTRMTSLMVLTKSERRESNRMTTWMWPLRLLLEGPHRHPQEIVPVVGLLTAGIARMNETAGMMTDLVDALVIHEMNLTNLDMIEGTGIMADGMIGVPHLVTTTVTVTDVTEEVPLFLFLLPSSSF